MCTTRRLMQNAISHSSVSIRSIQMCMCAFALPQEQKRNRFGTVAFDVHRMFHHDETALTTRASGLGWTSAGLPHMQEVHSNWRTNPVKPSNPLRKLTHTIPIIVSCIPNSTDFCFCPPQCGLYGFRDQNKVERLSPVDPGNSGESPTCILHEGIHARLGYCISIPVDTFDRCVNSSIDTHCLDQ